MSEIGNESARPNLGSDQPQGESRPMSFTERKAEQLREERTGTDGANFDGAPSNLNQVEVPVQEAQDPAHQSDDGYPLESIDPAFAETAELTEDIQEAEVEGPNVEGEAEEADIPQLRQRAEEAESLVAGMQKDYTQKTQKLGEQRRELATSLEQSTQIAAMYDDRASKNLARYEGVNWQQLQATLDPSVYNQRVAEYRQAVNIRDQAKAEHENIRQKFGAALERQKQDEAEVSRDILRSTIPKWGDELYGKIRTHAIKSLSFTEEDFDNIVDHRLITLMHRDMLVSNSGSTVKGIQHNGIQSRPQGQNRPTAQPANGSLRKAEETYRRNPGDRNAGRNVRLERLQKERRGR